MTNVTYARFLARFVGHIEGLAEASIKAAVTAAGQRPIRAIGCYRAILRSRGYSLNETGVPGGTVVVGFGGRDHPAQGTATVRFSQQW